MIEWFLLDGVHAKTAGASISGKDDLISLACSHETEAALSFMQLAEARTEIALDASIGQGVPVFG